LQLLESEIFSERICELCAQDLNVFAKIRVDLISKQKDLYDLAGLDEQQYKSLQPPTTYEEVDPDNQMDMDMSMEYIEQEDETTFDEQMTEDHLFEERIVDEDDAESADSSQQFLKIEKVEEGSLEVTEGSNSFECFEEIVIVDSNHKVKEEYSLKKDDSSYWVVDE
jgi:hypothetical protein